MPALGPPVSTETGDNDGGCCDDGCSKDGAGRDEARHGRAIPAMPGRARAPWSRPTVSIGRRRRSILAAMALLALSSPTGALEWSGRLELEARGFARSPAYPHQRRHGLSFAVQPELHHSFDDDRQSVSFTPFVRVDSADGRRTHVDIRELMYQRVFDEAELRVGIGRVFWGVTEAEHLVDTINQTDLVENVDREDKLGQPLVNLSLVRDWGTVDLFVLPWFRERTFPGREGRLRSEPFVDVNRTTYESGAGRHRLDFAVRWSHAVGDFDMGVAHFRGTSREPLLRPVCAASACNPLTGQGPVLARRYEVVNRTSLDLQATKGATLWKVEALHVSGSEDAYIAWVAGFEYTWFGICGSGVDLGLLGEHLFDGRGGTAPHPLENDLFAGVRLGFNDAAGTELLAGIVADAEGDGTVLSLEAARRIGDRWKVELEARAWNAVARDDPMFSLRSDDYVQLTLSRFF